jgi:hypothetical protein
MLTAILSYLLGEAQSTDESIMPFQSKRPPVRNLEGFDEWLKFHQLNNNILIKVKNI